jgi:7-carboxy-7-deazaguanine synthase
MTATSAGPRVLRVNEIFVSLQGESSQNGRPCVFVRLTGCPLRCTYCDTEYAFFEGASQTFDEVFEKINSFGVNLVELTGGEPLAHPNAFHFLREAEAAGFELMVETGGAHSIANVPNSVKIIMDLKTPGSGESHRNYWDNLGLLKPGKDEIKFVITSREDFDWACGVTRDKKLLDTFIVLMSPAQTVPGKPNSPHVSPRDLANWVVESKMPFRFQIQLHKLLWGAETRGV